MVLLVDKRRALVLLIPEVHLQDLAGPVQVLDESGIPCSSSDLPTVQRAAIFAQGTPVALPTKGTVREARGFASSTWMRPPWTANCTFIRPTTFRCRASATVWREISLTISGRSENGGSAQA